MSRFLLLTFVATLCLLPVRAADPGVRTTIAYVEKLQTKSGGFLPQARGGKDPGVPSLRATSAAVRILHYLDVPVPNKEACAKFVASCHDTASGGFADAPKGKPDVFATAVGLMAVKALKMPMETFGPGAARYLTENARSFEDIRIAAAGMESMQAQSPKNQVWLTDVQKGQNSDGTFGKDGEQARATASAAVTILRLGGTPKDTAAVLKALRNGQRLNGGFGKGDNELASDLETTYRVMRCFMMLKAQPNRVEGLRTFIAKCRNEDGGYGVSPGQPSSIGGTYFATTILHWQEAK